MADRETVEAEIFSLEIQIKEKRRELKEYEVESADLTDKLDALQSQQFCAGDEEEAISALHPDARRMELEIKMDELKRKERGGSNEASLKRKKADIEKRLTAERNRCVRLGFKTLKELEAEISDQQTLVGDAQRTFEEQRKVFQQALQSKEDTAARLAKELATVRKENSRLKLEIFKCEKQLQQEKSKKKTLQSAISEFH